MCTVKKDSRINTRISSFFLVLKIKQKGEFDFYYNKPFFAFLAKLAEGSG
jgi:hypothetical protein